LRAALATLFALAACQGAVAPPLPARSASPGPAGAVEAREGQLPSSAPSPPSSTPRAGPGPEAAAIPVEMRGPVPTAFANNLRALGIDAAHLPRLEHLDARALRGVMTLFARSLGLRCGDCHEEGDFAAPTPRKKIATHMWNDFVARLTLQDAPIFCDSCHQGRTRLLDRRDEKALSRWMDDHYVTGLARADGRSHGCETCHVDMEMHLFALWTR